MSRLSDGTIRRMVADGTIGVEPLPDDDQYQPASLDLRLGATFKELTPSHDPLDPADHDSVRRAYRPVSKDSGRFVDDALVLNPGEFVLGTTRERVSVPPHLEAEIEGRSSYGRLAITVHATARYVDPGFRGHLTLEILNIGPRPVVLRPGTKICQLRFASLDTECVRPYGEKPNSKYQDQTDPTESRIHLDSPGVQ